MGHDVGVFHSFQHLHVVLRIAYNGDLVVSVPIGFFQIIDDVLLVAAFLDDFQIPSR